MPDKVKSAGLPAMTRKVALAEIIGAWLSQEQEFAIGRAEVDKSERTLLKALLVLGAYPDEHDYLAYLAAKWMTG